MTIYLTFLQLLSNVQTAAIDVNRKKVLYMAGNFFNPNAVVHFFIQLMFL